MLDGCVSRILEETDFISRGERTLETKSSTPFRGAIIESV